MSDRSRDLARLSHDVGKYIARAARNVEPSGPIAPALIDLLIEDLYAIDGRVRASDLFRERAARFEGTSDEATLERMRALLAAIDELEARVRAKDGEAIRHAVGLALAVSDGLDELARGARE